MKRIFYILFFMAIPCSVFGGDMYEFDEFLTATIGHNPYSIGPKNPVPTMPVPTPDTPSDNHGRGGGDGNSGNMNFGDDKNVYVMQTQAATTVAETRVEKHSVSHIASYQSTQDDDRTHTHDALWLWTRTSRLSTSGRKRRKKSKTYSAALRRSEQMKEGAVKTVWFRHQKNLWSKTDRRHVTAKVRKSIGRLVARCGQIRYVHCFYLLTCGKTDSLTDTTKIASQLSFINKYAFA